MFENLLSFWKGKDFLLQVMEDFKVMLDEAESMFEAVCLALVARHFKRIAAHLVNIATSVILPLSDLNYFDERTRED